MLDLPAEYYLDTVQARCSRSSRCPRGACSCASAAGAAAGDPGYARCSTIEGELDDISGNGQTEAAHALCLNIPRDRREHFLAPSVGHYGIFSGRRWREMVFPKRARLHREPR